MHDRILHHAAVVQMAGERYRLNDKPCAGHHGPAGEKKTTAG
jgi:hypothetical protein